jgi:hypothetical protein
MTEHVSKSAESSHEIRLRKPWVKTVDDQQPIEGVDVPDTASPDGERLGVRVHYRRHFNCPSGLGESRVRLRIRGWKGHLKGLRLNETEVLIDSSASQVDADITELLQSHNQLAVVLMGTPKVEPHLSGEVTLAIVDRAD